MLNLIRPYGNPFYWLLGIKISFANISKFFISVDGYDFCSILLLFHTQGVAKVVDIDPLGSMGLSKGSIKA
ncbi:hypothetical protein T02_5785 [Trichinella nativa]|uniref:Uncharacterized protein n=1 Tax=Trichinella nativa TaxID=6335 RepID=A0A0V1KYH3_9BILA|nr:hypothetical protein T02_5785 [Trichinella nativa]